MFEDVAIFTIILVGMILVWTTLNNIIKLRTRSRADAGGDLAAQRRIELLAGENDGLKGQVGRLEDRISVLERIATDPAARTAREIEDLRIS
jgi:hypothetical protein